MIFMNITYYQGEQGEPGPIGFKGPEGEQVRN